MTARVDDAGVGWPARMPEGWTETGSTTATFKPVLLQAAPCFPVLPTDPVVTQATCTAGEVTVPTIELASDAGRGDLRGRSGWSVWAATTADAGDGDGDVVGRVEVGDVIPPWVKVDNVDGDGQRSTLNAASCDEVTPADPTFTQAVCRNGASSRRR